MKNRFSNKKYNAQIFASLALNFHFDVYSLSENDFILIVKNYVRRIFHSGRPLFFSKKRKSTSNYTYFFFLKKVII